MLINRIELYSRNINSDMFDAHSSEKIYTRTMHVHLQEPDNKQHCKSCDPSEAYPTRCSIRIYTLCSYYITLQTWDGCLFCDNTIHHWDITDLKSRGGEWGVRRYRSLHTSPVPTSQWQHLRATIRKCAMPGSSTAHVGAQTNTMKHITQDKCSDKKKVVFFLWEVGDGV